MPITVHCQHCDEIYEVEDRFAGKRINCRECKKFINVLGGDGKSGDGRVRPGEPRGKNASSPDKPHPVPLAEVARRIAPRSRAKVALFWVGGVLFVLFVICMGSMGYFEQRKKKAHAYLSRTLNEPQSFGPAVSIFRKVLLADAARPESAQLARSARDVLQGELSNGRARITGGDVPGTAQDLHAEFLRCLEFQDEAMQKLSQVLSIIEDNRLTMDQKRASGWQILAEIEARERTHHIEIRRLQNEVAGSVGITISDAPNVPIQPFQFHPQVLPNINKR